MFGKKPQRTGWPDDRATYDDRSLQGQLDERAQVRPGGYEPPASAPVPPDALHGEHRPGAEQHGAPAVDQHADRGDQQHDRQHERPHVPVAPQPTAHGHEVDDRSALDRMSRKDRRHLLRDDVGLAEARQRFGGVDGGASIAGTIAGVGMVVLLAGLAAAIGTVGYRSGAGDEELSIGALATGLVVLFVGFLFGGWVAGRMARYDGARNGLVAGLLFIVLGGAISALGGVFGDRYDFFDEVNLPQWFTTSDGATAALISAGLGILAVLLGGALGGAIGSRYHRKADALIVATDRMADRAVVSGPADVSLVRDGGRQRVER